MSRARLQPTVICDAVPFECGWLHRQKTGRRPERNIIFGSCHSLSGVDVLKPRKNVLASPTGPTNPPSTRPSIVGGRVHQGYAPCPIFLPLKKASDRILVLLKSRFPTKHVFLRQDVQVAVFFRTLRTDLARSSGGGMWSLLLQSANSNYVHVIKYHTVASYGSLLPRACLCLQGPWGCLLLLTVVLLKQKHILVEISFFIMTPSGLS